MKIPRISQAVALACCAALATAPLTACGAGSTPRPKPAAAAAAAADEGDLNAYRPGALAFYRSFAMGESARSVEHYTRIADGAPAATAVVVAEVARVEPTRTIGAEVKDFEVSMIGVVLRPVEVLAGQVPADHADELTVEFIGNSDPATVDRLRATLPEGHLGVWFLRHKIDQIPGKPALTILPEEAPYWRVVSPQGLFVQGETGVETPLAETLPGATDMATEGRQYNKLSDLVGTIRTA